jgi:hypothetical protein
MSIDKDSIYAAIGIIFGVVLVFILYSMFFSDIDSSISATKLQQVEAILPHGSTLNIDSITKYGAKTNRFTYPKVDPNMVGITNFAELVRPK